MLALPCVEAEMELILLEKAKTGSCLCCLNQEEEGGRERSGQTKGNRDNGIRREKVTKTEKERGEEKVDGKTIHTCTYTVK